MKKWTDEETAKIIEMYNNKILFKDIAIALNRTEYSITRKVAFLKKKGKIERDKPRQTMADIESLEREIVQMVNNEWGYSKISRELKISVKLLTRFCKDKKILSELKRLKLNSTPEEYKKILRLRHYERRRGKRQKEYNNLSKEKRAEINEKRRQDRLKNKEVYKKKSREYARLDILRLCGMSLEDARNWYANTKKECQICGRTDNLGIDHCHKRMIVRGFLCKNCNSGIGLLKENINNFKKAIEYIEKHN